MIIFVASKGLLDDIPLNLVKKFESGLFAFVDKECPEVPRSIAETKAFSGEAMNSLERTASLFKAQFMENNQRTTT